MSTIGPRRRNVSNKNLRVHVRLANILHITPPRELPNAIASKISFMIRPEERASNNSPKGHVLTVNWWFKMEEDSNATADHISRDTFGFQMVVAILISNKGHVRMASSSELIPKILGLHASSGGKRVPPIPTKLLHTHLPTNIYLYIK